MTFKKGDLVMVVKPMPCCGVAGSSLGKIFKFIQAERNTGLTPCCNIKHTAMSASVEGGNASLLHLSRLIKIDPPAEQDQETTNKELEVLG